MGREVYFNNEEFVLKLTGILSIVACKWQLKVPYNAIKKVYIDEFEAPLWMLRFPGAAIAPLHIFEGRFKFGNEWYFLSCEHPVPLVHLEVEGIGKFKYIIFEMENPRAVMIELRKRMRKLDD